MGWKMLIDLMIRLRALFRRNTVEAELGDELRFHFDQQVGKFVQSGLPLAEARRRARLLIGGPDQIKEECRDARGVQFLESLSRDFRFGLRMLRRNPGFTAVAVLTLALGIGANTAIFSVLESQLWRPLPFPDSERLVNVAAVRIDNPKQWDLLPSRIFDAWRKQSRSFENFAAYDYPEPRSFTANGGSERVLVMAVTSNFFDTLKLAPQQGRAFRPEEETPEGPRVAIVSDALWKSRFASDASLVGKKVALDGDPYVVVGIAPAKLRFEYIEEPAVYVPFTIDHSSEAPLQNSYTIGRLASGVSAAHAQAELAGILAGELRSEGVSPEIMPLVENLRVTWTSFGARPLYFFAGAIGLVLLIACVNTAGLLLARGLARQREYSVRAALGAGRGTLMRQSLVESLILTLSGGTAGILFGIWGANAFAVFIPADSLPRNTQIALDARVLLFTFGISIASAALLGLVPAIFASRVELNEVLRQSSRSSTGSAGQIRARSSLVVAEVALALVLLFGAGLFLSTFVHETNAPRGFDAPGVLTLRVALKGKQYAKLDQVRRYYDELLGQIRSLTGVRNAALGTGLPLATRFEMSVKLAGQPPKGRHGFGVMVRNITPNYFDMFHIKFLAGRAFTEHDTGSSVRVAIINLNFAKQFFGSDDPLGKVLEFMPDRSEMKVTDAPVQIVGITENTQDFGPMELPFPDLYLPFAQNPVAATYVALQTDGPPVSLIEPARKAAFSVSEDQPVFDVQTMDARVAQSVKGARFNMFLVAVLAGIAVALVSVGIFGTIAYFVQQRTQEFGIRMALGASPGRILRHTIAQSLAMGASGLVVGIMVSLILGRILRSVLYMAPHEHTGMLYGVSIYDPLTMSIACCVLVAVLLLASYVPARRAMRVDPMVALRYE